MRPVRSNIRQPHSAPAFAGVAPQGSLVATSDALIVPGGRSVPAVFDRATGALKYFELNAGGKGTGGSFVAANEQSWFVHTRERGVREFALSTGLKTAFTPNEPVLAGDVIYAAQMQADKLALRAYKSDTKEELWQLPIDATGDLILAKNQLVCAGKSAQGSLIQIIDLALDRTKPEGDAAMPSPRHRGEIANSRRPIAGRNIGRSTARAERWRSSQPKSTTHRTGGTKVCWLFQSVGQSSRSDL